MNVSVLQVPEGWVGEYYVLQVPEGWVGGYYVLQPIKFLFPTQLAGQFYFTQWVLWTREVLMGSQRCGMRVSLCRFRNWFVISMERVQKHLILHRKSQPEKHALGKRKTQGNSTPR